MTRKRFLTPPAIPETDKCRGIVFPDSFQWESVFSAALYETTLSHNYEQVNETDLTPDQAAAEAYARYQVWLDAGCGGACELPSGSRIYRIHPTTGKFEYLDDGEWVEDADIPPVPAREEPTEYDRLCAAASNAVEVLRLTWQEAMTQYDANVSAQDAEVDTVLQISALVGAVFYPPVFALAELTQLGWEVVYWSYQVLTSINWDEQFTDMLVCIFKQYATEDAGVVHFDFNAITKALWTGAFTGRVYLTMAGQLQWILNAIGPTGLDTAGSLDIVTGDCVTCDTWSYTFQVFNIDWVITQGTLTASPAYDVWAKSGSGGWWYDFSLVVDTSHCRINRVSFYHQQQSTTTTQRISVLPSDGSFTYSQSHVGGGPVTIDTGVPVDGRWSNSDTTTVRIWQDKVANSYNSQVNYCTIYGTGTNPFV